MAVRGALPVFALGILVSGLAPRPAVAATANASFGVSARVEATCQASATGRAFRIVTGGTATTTSPVSVNCSNGAQYNVKLDAENGFGANLALRQMIGSGTALLGNGRNTSLPGLGNRDQSVGTDAALLTDNRSAQVQTGHERVAAGQHVPDGAYFDTIIVTVTY
jgi:spore coat protein U-like protein